MTTDWNDCAGEATLAKKISFRSYFKYLLLTACFVLIIPIRPSDVIIAVMGVTGVGKTSFISLFTKEDLMIGHSLEACEAPLHVRFLKKNPLIL